MPAVAEERVLVVPTSRFHDLGHFQGFSADMGRYLPALLEGDDLSYRPRGEMEQDPSFKQLIPYVVFRYIDAAGTVHVFQYTRGGGQGEARLHAKRSVGVGGHISIVDHESILGPSPSGRGEGEGGAGTSCTLTPTLSRGERGIHHDVYREGMLRELAEEVIIDAEYSERCVGLINDDETPVGQVHLGVVHICDVDQPAVRNREEDILDSGFRPVSEILANLDRFESWSQIVMRALFG